MAEGEQLIVKRVFVNDVHEYSSKNIAKYLSKCENGDTSEGEDEEDDEDEEKEPGEPIFTVVGTVPAPPVEDLRFPIEYIMPTSREDLFYCLMDCDVVVYNISESSTIQQVEEAEWAFSALSEQMNNFKSRKIFILVTTVMTWTMTKPHDPEDPDAPLLESNFRQRRPHPNFRPHYNLERTVLKMPRGKKFKLRCYIVAPGIQYGMGENLFHYFFKTAWSMQLPAVPMFGEGSNTIPMIHVNDLGGVIQNIIETKPLAKYILAIDESKNPFKAIVKMISDVLGPEKVEEFPLTDAIQMNALEPQELECISIDLHLEAEVVREFSINWFAKGGLFENMELIALEYKTIRELLPIKICVVGPPASGKTTIAKKLSRYYQLHYISIKEIVEETISRLEAIINDPSREFVNDEAVIVATRQLESMNKSMQMNQGLLTDGEIANLLQKKLSSRPCLNQGYVLDGFLKTYTQAKQIFLPEDLKDHEQEGTHSKPKFNKIITPEYVLALRATDDFLIARVQGFQQSIAEEMQYTEEDFVPRLSKYRQVTETEETLLDFFDEREIHPEIIDINVDDPEYTYVMKQILECVGKSKNYGLTQDIQEEEDRKKEAERKQKQAEDNAVRRVRRKNEMAEMVCDYEIWQLNLAEVKRQEVELQEAQSLNLRSYLMKYIIPSLIEAMTECTEIRTEDPVDFVAEFLIRRTPQE